MGKSKKKPKKYPSRANVSEHGGKPIITIKPDPLGERMFRYVYYNLIGVVALATGLPVFLSAKIPLTAKSFALYFGPAVFLFLFVTWLSYRSFGKANSKVTTLLCDGKNMVVTNGKKQNTCPLDKIRLERRIDNKYGMNEFDCYQIMVFIRRVGKKRLKLFRMIQLPDNDIANIKSFCTKNGLHYKEVNV